MWKGIAFGVIEMTQKMDFSKSFLVIASSFVFFSAKASAEKLSLKEAESFALEQSSEIKAAQEEIAGTDALSEAEEARQYPSLSLVGNYRYNTIVPEIEAGPKKIPFGDHKAYSIGPVLNFSLYDGGMRRNLIQSIQAVSQANQHQLSAVKNQLLLNVRLAYIRTQIAKTEYDLVRQTLELTKKQAKDIATRFRNGAASKLDFLSAQREVLAMDMRSSASKGELQVTSKDLAALINRQIDPETLVLDALDQANSAFHQENALQRQHPRLLFLDKIADSKESAAQSQKSAFLPHLQLTLKSSLDYPNGPTLENIHQNTIAIGFEMPLFDWGAIDRSVSKQRAEASATRLQREALERELHKEGEKARARLAALKEELLTAQKAVKDSRELARLTYEAYKDGHINLTEVQSKNLMLLAAEVDKTRIDGQLSMQSYILQSLTHPEK